MKIRVNENSDIEFSDVFNSIVIDTPSGKFGICQRDGTIEIIQNGETVFRAEQKPEPEPEMVWVNIDEPVRAAHPIFAYAITKFQRLVPREEAGD